MVFCKNKTSIIVSNRVSSVKEAHHIIVLDKGRIIEEGNHEKLLKNKGTYAELFNKQQDEKTF